MNRHLSDDEILEWVMGTREPAWEIHTRNCEQCASGIERLAEPLRLFRDSVESLSIQAAHVKPRALNRWRPAFFWPAVIAGAMLLVFAALPYHRLQPPSAITASEVLIPDDVLLQRVDSEIAASVPLSMEPLDKLMTAGMRRSN